MADTPRVYPFETIYNFRDFGGYATDDGREVVRGRLFRSANLARLSDAELSAIAALDIDLVVDMRYAPERERQPSRFWDTGPAHLFEFTPTADSVVHKVAPHEAFMQTELHTAEDSRAHMYEGYRKRPHDPGFRALARRTFEHMRDTGDGLLIHCAAGKDRTGTLAALILFALGVDARTIREDFMLTMEAVDIDAMLPPAARMIGERYGRDYDPEALRPMFGVEEGYLDAALESMGDPLAYLDAQLDVGADARETLRERYLKPA